MPRLTDLRDHIDDQVGLAIRVAADEHRAGRTQEAEMAMGIAVAGYRTAEALSLMVAQRRTVQGVAVRRLRENGVGQRILAAWSVLIGGR